MKTFFTCLLIVLLTGCLGKDSSKKVVEDSLEYYPPTPGTIPKNEFREYYRKLSEFFDSSLLKPNFNGGILVALNGTVIYEKYTGVRDLRKKDPLTDTTPMHIASTSKTFTAAAVLRLVQENRLSLDDSLSKFFPAIPYHGITIRMLLNHRSGLPNYLYFMSNSEWDKKVKATNKDVLRVMDSLVPNRVFAPDTHFSYCNTNFMLLAMIIEQITGVPYPQYMEQKIFGPLQMKHTYAFTLKDTLTATPSFSPNGTYWDYDFLDGTYGDKNIYTTPQDLLKWDQALYSGQLLNQAMLDSAFKGYSNEKVSMHNYGLGWHLETMPNGKKIVYHFGKWHGSNAAFARLLDEKATIIIIGNRFNKGIYRAAHLCYDIFGNYMQHGEKESPENDADEKKN